MPPSVIALKIKEKHHSCLDVFNKIRKNKNFVG